MTEETKLGTSIPLPFQSGAHLKEEIAKRTILYLFAMPERFPHAPRWRIQCGVTAELGTAVSLPLRGNSSCR